jgi:hypothetical protein
MGILTADRMIEKSSSRRRLEQSGEALGRNVIVLVKRAVPKFDLEDPQLA